MSFVVGVDVGGTNCDAVVTDRRSGELLCWAKRPTSTDVVTGISDVVRAALETAATEIKEFSFEKVAYVGIGTTHFLNAALQKQGLHRVAHIRLCGPAGRGIPAYSGWDPTMVEAIRLQLQATDENIGGGVLYARGGHQITTGRDLEAPDEAQVKGFAQQVLNAGHHLYSVTSMGEFLDLENAEGSSQEQTVRRWIQEVDPGAFVTCGSSHGKLGFLERENVCILNSSLRPLACHTIDAFQQALSDCSLPAAQLVLTQNDGTVCFASIAKDFPVRCFSSGATNSVRGGAKLVQSELAIVVDVGGTTTDYGLVKGGEPTERSSEALLAGVRTNLHMPDVYSHRLGTGTVCHDTSGILRERSVAEDLFTEARCYQGSQVTTTCITIARKLRQGVAMPSFLQGPGISQAVLDAVPEDAQQTAYNGIIARLKKGIELMHPGNNQVCDVVLVGGGAVIVDPRDLEAALAKCGVGRVLLPSNYCVANAYGASMLQVAVEVDIVRGDFPSSDKVDADGKTIVTPRDVLQEQYMEKLVTRMVQIGVATKGLLASSAREVKGARRCTKAQYTKNDLFQITVKVVGQLDPDAQPARPYGVDDSARLTEGVMFKKGEASEMCDTVEVDTRTMAGCADKRPNFDESGRWCLDFDDVQLIVAGAALLGTGGGGDPYLGKLFCLQALKDGHMLRIIPANAFDNAPESEAVAASFMAGSPEIALEKLISGKELSAAFDHIREKMVKEQKQLVATAAVEIGGLNSMFPLITGARLGLDVVDADGMRRAYPHIPCCLMFIRGHPMLPMTFSNEFGEVSEVTDGAALGDVIFDFGGTVGGSMTPLPARDIQQKMIPHSYTICWRIGKLIASAHKDQRIDSIPDSLVDLMGGQVVIRDGKVITVEDRNDGTSFTQRRHHIASSDGARTLTVEAQNEYLLVKHGAELVCSTPDLICIIDAATGYPVTNERIRTSMRVHVLCLPSAPEMCDEAALPLTGPEFFASQGMSQAVGLTNADWQLVRMAPAKPIQSIWAEYGVTYKRAR